MATNVVTAPTASGVIPQRFFVEPIGGPKDVFYYLDAFPEALYRKTPDAHLYKFMRTLLGEQGVNWIRKNYTLARLLLEERGLDMFDLDKFYGDPFQFGRILEESLIDDPTGLIPRDQWNILKAKNSRYRNRALDFVNGAKAGNTPEGIRLVAKSGLGHDVEIYENYRWLFDIHSDDPLGLPNFGKSAQTEEFVVLPRRELSQVVTHNVDITGFPYLPDGGGFVLFYNGDSTTRFGYTTGGVTNYSVPWNATADELRLSLEAFPQIGVGNISISGHFPSWKISLVGAMANRNVFDITAQSFLTYSGAASDIGIKVTRSINYEDSVQRIVSFAENDKYHLQQALDRIRPVNTFYTVAPAQGVRSRTDWRSVRSSSEYSEVARFVTGSLDIHWPSLSATHWIEPGIEKQAPRAQDDLQYHYQGFQNIFSATESSIGVTLNPDESTTPHPGKYALADYFEPLFVTSTIEVTPGTAASFINGIYPSEYHELPGAPAIAYEDRFWMTAERAADESLILDLGDTKAVNNVLLEVAAATVQVDIEYEVSGNPDQKVFLPVTPHHEYSNIVAETDAAWVPLGLRFTNSKDNIVFTRYLKLKFTRLRDYTLSLRVRSVRVARNIS